MPFTLAHPLAAAPLLRPLRRWGVLSALVLGSCMPDMPYFLALPVERELSHSLAGLLWFCLPVGLLSYLLFHKLLKGPLLALLPDTLLGRLAPQVAACTALPAASWAAVAVSLLCGAATHDAWDAFTHDDGWAVGWIAPLQQAWFTWQDDPVYGYALAQHASSVLGVAMLALWCRHWLRQQPAQSVRLPLHLGPTAKACVFALPAALPLLAGIWAGLDIRAQAIAEGLEPWPFFVHELVFTPLSVGTLVLLAYSLGWQAWRLRATARPA